MQIAVISASGKQPGWVRSGFETYARRIRGGLELTLAEVPLAKRGKSLPTGRLVAEEGRRMLSAVPKRARVIAMAESGRSLSTPALRDRLGHWLEEGRPVALLIGGPDGLSADCVERADETWSLSPLTLPHGLVRVIVAEAIYRAWSLLENHPYHRA